MEPTQYVYQPLDNATKKKKYPWERNEFMVRIIALAPATQESDPLKCSIRHVQMPHSETRFATVSYVWGSDDRSSFSLLCEEGKSKIQITASVDRVLRRFRRADEERLLWIDGICINQDDLIERKQQVQRMSQIYQYSSCMIWLGDGPIDEQGHGNEKMSKMVEVLWGLSSSQYENVTTAARADDAIQYELKRQFGTEDLAPLHEFLALPWFTRRWVVQEATLGNCHIYCANKDITWHAFTHAFSVFALSTFKLDQQVIDHIRQIDNLSENLTSPFEEEERFQEGILDLLVRFHAPQCKDERDRIYGLLNLAEDVKQLDRWPRTGKLRHLVIEPDYEIQGPDVYRAFAEQLLTRKKHLDLLQCAAAFQSNNDESRSQPTWIPDWRQCMRHTPLLNVPWFTAGGPAMAGDVPQITFIDTWCLVEGVYFDDVTFVYQFPKFEDNASSTTRTMAQLEGLCMSLPLLRLGITYERLWQILGLVFIADHALSRTLRQRYAEGRRSFHDGLQMKRNARERDTQVLLDWMLSLDDDLQVDWEDANCGMVSYFSAEETNRRKSLYEHTLHRTKAISCFLKPSATAHEWHESSSDARSGWHSAIDPEDLPYFMEWTEKMAGMGGAKESQDSQNALEPIEDVITEEVGSQSDSQRDEELEPILQRDSAVADGQTIIDANPEPIEVREDDDGTKWFSTSDVEICTDKAEAVGQEQFEEEITPQTDPAKPVPDQHPMTQNLETQSDDDDEESATGESSDDIDKSSDAAVDTEENQRLDLLRRERSLKLLETLDSLNRSIQAMTLLMANPLSSMLSPYADQEDDGVTAKRELWGDTKPTLGYAIEEVNEDEDGIQAEDQDDGQGEEDEVDDDSADDQNLVQDDMDDSNSEMETSDEEDEAENPIDESSSDDFDDDSDDESISPFPTYEANDHDEVVDPPMEADNGAWRGNQKEGFICFKPHEQNTERYAELASRTLSGRAFIVTKEGFMGIAPEDVRIGDTVAVFKGGRTPFIIRKDERKGSRGGHCLIGDCYVHGIMRGEAMNVPEVQLKEFVLV